MNFSTPQKVQDIIQAGDDVERVRAANRIKVDQLANGAPPLTAEEAKRWSLKVNFNSMEGPLLFANARRQYTNAVIQPGRFFKVTSQVFPAEQKLEWEMWITNFINRVMKKNKSYFHLNQNRFCSLVAHGIGPQLWYDKECWLPKYVAIGDLRVPTDTETSMESLPWCAIRHLYTPGELIKKVWSANADPGWNKKYIAEILNEYKDINWETTSYNWMDAPERMAELVKQNMGYFTSDAVPTIPLWHFYFYDDDAECWKLRVLPVVGEMRGPDQKDDKFLYESQKPAAKELSNFLHVQFGDLSGVAPAKYHSIRSLGFLLMEPCFWSNLSLCRSIQHLFEQFNIWLRSADPGGKARAQKLEMFNQCWLPEGVSVVPQTERHQIDSNFLEMVSARLKQLQSEASASYTQQVDNGTHKEQTAYETHVKASMVNAMMTGLLTVFFFQETFAYQEICRRFCLRNTMDPDAKRFQKEAAAMKIPKQYLNAELWDIEPVVPLGSGNPAIAMSEATQLMSNKEKFDTTAQQEIMHDWVATVTGDWQKAARLAPLDKARGVTDAQRDSEFAFATLMHGVPVRMKEGLSPIDQIDTLLGLMAGVVTRIEQQTNLATPTELIGLQTVAQYIGQLIQSLAQNQAEKPRAKQYSQVLGKLMNTLKGFAQRLQQQNQAGNGNGMDAETAAKLQAKQIEAQSSAKIKEAKSTQQLQHKERSFRADQRRKDAEAFAEIERQKSKTAAEIVHRRFSAFEPE